MSGEKQSADQKIINAIEVVDDEKSSTQKQNSEKHVKNLKTYTCETCTKIFKFPSTLRKHKKRQYPCRRPTHYCDRCKRRFVGYQCLWNHKQRCKVVSQSVAKDIVKEEIPDTTQDIDTSTEAAVAKDVLTDVVNNLAVRRAHTVVDGLAKKRKRYCQRHVEPIILKWNGKSWETKSTNVHYKMNLGRDLSDLLQRRAIKEEALNSKQRDYIRMYNSLF